MQSDLLRRKVEPEHFRYRLAKHIQVTDTSSFAMSQHLKAVYEHGVFRLLERSRSRNIKRSRWYRKPPRAGGAERGAHERRALHPGWFRLRTWNARCPHTAAGTMRQASSRSRMPVHCCCPCRTTTEQRCFQSSARYQQNSRSEIPCRAWRRFSFSGSRRSVVLTAAHCGETGQ